MGLNSIMSLPYFHSVTFTTIIVIPDCVSFPSFLEHHQLDQNIIIDQFCIVPDLPATKFSKYKLLVFAYDAVSVKNGVVLNVMMNLFHVESLHVKIL